MAEGQAMGVRVVADTPLDHLSPVTEASSGRRLDVTLQRGPEAAEGLSVQRDGDAYVVAAGGHGTHRLRATGQTVTSVSPGAPDEAWYRLFFAQVLPIAAALQGLEPLHASAVELEGRVVAVTAPSGVGKSTVMANLVAGGAGFVSDDVLAVEVTDDGPVAHAGPRYARLRPDVLAGLPESTRERFGPTVSDEDKVQASPVTAVDAAALAVVCVLERGHAGTSLQVEEAAGDAPALLTATFVPHVDERERLATQLDVAAAVSRQARCVRIRIPQGTEPTSVADVIAALV